MWQIWFDCLKIHFFQVRSRYFWFLSLYETFMDKKKLCFTNKIRQLWSTEKILLIEWTKLRTHYCGLKLPSTLKPFITAFLCKPNRVTRKLVGLLHYSNSRAKNSNESCWHTAVQSIWWAKVCLLSFWNHSLILGYYTMFFEFWQ